MPTILTLPMVGPTPVETPDVSATSCGYPQTATLSYAPTSIVLCVSGPGCVNSSINLDGGVGYGSIVVTSADSLADVTFSGNVLQLEALRPGVETLQVSDAAESLSQSIQLAVIAGGANDGTFVQAGLDGTFCLNAQQRVEFTSNAPVSITIADPAALSVSASVVHGIITDYEVTPRSLSATTLTATAGANSIVAPIDVVACATSTSKGQP